MSKNILISAYAVNPYKGSEDGTGWNICREIAKENCVTVITRKNNIPHIDAYRAENPDAFPAGMNFIGYDLPNWIMQLKKKLGERGYVLYYYFWQLMLPLFIKQKRIAFDIAHAVNFHSDSIPTFLWMLGKPTFWGPVGHHPVVPKNYILPVYGRAAFLKDRLYFSVKWCLRNLDPFFYLAVWRVEKIFAINSTVAKAMNAPVHKVEIVPAVASEVPSTIMITKRGFKVLSVGRFHYMKGFDLTIRAFASFVRELDADQRAEAELILVGKGEERFRLKQIAIEAGIAEKIRWVDWVDKSEMNDLYLESSVFLFPSHEGAGMVVPEAMSHGLPVIVLDNAGPGELAGEAAVKIKQGSYDFMVKQMSNALLHLIQDGDFRTSKGAQARERFSKHFTWKAMGTKIKAAYNNDQKAMAIFHPSSELYGADRILVNAINAMPKDLRKTVYLKFRGPLVEYIRTNTVNTEVKVIPFMPVIYRGIFNPKGMLRYASETIRFGLFFRSEHRSRKFASAYVNTLSISFVLPLLKALKIRNFVHVHEIIESPAMIGWLTAQLCKRYADKVVCVSKAVEDGLIGYSKAIAQRTMVLHNGIDAIHAAPRKPNGTLSFYLFGRIMPKKGQWYLIEALKQIPKEELQAAKFTLMGGPVPGSEHLLESLTEEIERAGLQSVVEMKGFAPSIVEAMEEADVCLVPSMMKDPFPTTVLEAMSAGRPVIATNHGGATEALNGSKGGLLVDPGAPDQLATGIRQLLRQREMVSTMGLRAKERYSSAFTKGHFNEKWMQFLKSEKMVA